MSNNAMLLFVLVFLWLVIAIQLGFSVRAWRIELREGMRLSRFRLTTTFVFFLLSTCFLVTTFFLPETIPFGKQKAAAEIPAPVSNPQNPAKPEDIPSLQRQLEEARKAVNDLDNQKQIAQQKVAELQKMMPPSSDLNNGEPSPRPDDVPLFTVSKQSVFFSFIAITTILALLGLISLFLGGEMITLFPPGWIMTADKRKDGDDFENEMLKLSSAVWRGEYREGLEMAEDISEKRLTGLDKFDYLFLRAYCAVMLTIDPDISVKEIPDLCERAISDLEDVIEDAPNRGEVLYLLGLAYGITNRNLEALEMFERAEPTLRLDAPLLKENKSVCLLKLAEISLSEGNTEKAETYFQAVTELGKLADSMIDSRIKIGMIDVQNAVNSKDLTMARTAVAKLGNIKGLKDTQLAQIEIINTAFNARMALREGRADDAIILVDGFLKKHMPADLPEPDEEVADETLDLTIKDSDLPFRGKYFAGFYL